MWLAYSRCKVQWLYKSRKTDIWKISVFSYQNFKFQPEEAWVKPRSQNTSINCIYALNMCLSINCRLYSVHSKSIYWISLRTTSFLWLTCWLLLVNLNKHYYCVYALNMCLSINCKLYSISSKSIYWMIL